MTTWPAVEILRAQRATMTVAELAAHYGVTRQAMQHRLRALGITVITEAERERFRAMGRKGGAALAAKKSPGFYQAIGRKGGAKVKLLYGAEHYHAIGVMGGAMLLAARGADYYRAIATGTYRPDTASGDAP